MKKISLDTFLSKFIFEKPDNMGEYRVRLPPLMHHEKFSHRLSGLQTHGQWGKSNTLSIIAKHYVNPKESSNVSPDYKSNKPFSFLLNAKVVIAVISCSNIWTEGF
jgi:hypothetical protein